MFSQAKILFSCDLFVSLELDDFFVVSLEHTFYLTLSLNLSFFQPFSLFKFVSISLWLNLGLSLSICLYICLNLYLLKCLYVSLSHILCLILLVDSDLWWHEEEKGEAGSHGQVSAAAATYTLGHYNHYDLQFYCNACISTILVNSK